jgi:acetyl-CoA carboxylase beta subunit
METIYVIIKHEEHTDIARSLRNTALDMKSNTKYYTHEHFENPLSFQTEKEAAERIKKEIKKDTSSVFSIEERYVATKDERRKALVP